MKAIAVVLVIACGGGNQAEPPAAGTRIVYDLDLDRAIANHDQDLAARLSGEVHIPVLPLGEDLFTMTPEPARSAEVRKAITDQTGPMIEWTACPVTAAGGALCFKLAATHKVDAQRLAVATAAETMRARFAAMKVAATAVVQGTQIVVEVAGGDPQVMAVRGMVQRAGRLEFKIVDDNSEQMKHVFAHVGFADKPTDPVAVAAGIHAEVDAWPTESGERHIDYYLLGPDRAKLVAYLEQLGTSFTLPADRQYGFELVPPLRPGEPALWRTYYLERIAQLTGAQVTKAELVQDPNTDQPTVLLDFNRAGAERFGELTGRIVGKKLAIVLDGTVSSAPIINGPIRGGRASIAMGGSDRAKQRRDAVELTAILSTGALPAPLREVRVERAP
ncbi:MAG: hypothetical protein ABI867_21780 [Kofleriaceae bacterium]